jgi:hypothetical protein
VLAEEARAGEQIYPAMRVVQIADDVEVFYRVGGTGAAIGMLRSRRATEFDPALVDAFCARATGPAGRGHQQPRGSGPPARRS